MKSIGISIICKTPEPGRSKTRLSPPLRPEQCAEISASFIRDLSATMATLRGDAMPGYAIYTPVGSEARLRQLLPDAFGLIAQREGDFGERLRLGIEDLLALGHHGAIVINSDSPTLPAGIIADAAAALRRDGDCVALSRAADGGYTLIGLTRPHPRLFEDIPWSTENVYRLTRERAAEIGLEVRDVAPWYDIDDAASLETLRRELDGTRPSFATERHPPADAPATRGYLETILRTVS